MQTTFLTDNIPQVSVNEMLLSGFIRAPQGRVVGPLLFLILIAEINEKSPGDIMESFGDNTP